MKAKVIVSLGAVVGLAALSVVAFISSTDMGTVGIADESGVVSRTTFSEAKLTVMPMGSTGVDTLSAEKPVEPLCQLTTVSADWVSDEAYLLAKIAMAEAEGEDTEGKALVMLVVLNRVRADGFPDTIGGVVYQPRQFSPIANGRFDRVEPDADCWAALDLVMLDKWDGSYGATYFESESNSTWHSENLAFLFQHGKHYFYTDREGGGD